MKNWKLKKIVLISLLVILLSGCRTNHELTEENPVTTPLTTNDVEMSDDLSPDVLPYIIVDQEANSIVLIDLLTNERLADFSVEEDEMVLGFYSFPDHHYNVLVMADIDRDEEGGFALSFGGDSDENRTLTFLVLDASLNPIQTFEITDEQLFFGIWNAAVVFVDEEILVYYHDFMFGSGLYVYNVNTNSRSLVMEVENGLFLGKIQSTSLPDHLAFQGGRLDDEIHTYYGVIDLESGRIQYSQTDLPTSMMMVQGNYLLLTENPPAAFQRGVPRSEVVVFNLVTGEERILQLEGYESMNAIVIGDRYVLTGTYEQIRLYDIQTNDMVLERQPSVEMVRIESEMDADGELIEGVYPSIHMFLAINNYLYAVIFDIGDGTLHVELITIEE